MTTQKSIESDAASPVDTVLLLLSVAAIIGGIAAFYTLENQYNVAVRTAMVIGSIVVAAALAYQTQTGRTTWSYIRGASLEMRKTTWPSRQETLQSTLMIAVVVLLAALLLWGLDSLLLWGVKILTGRV